MGTLTAWIDSLHALTVTGVKRKEKFPPLSVNNPDLPYQFIVFPGSEYEAVTICSDTNRTNTAQIAIATEAVNQNEPAKKFSDMVTMIDNLHSALETNRKSLAFDASWTIEARAGLSDSPPLDIAGIPYWGVVATVTGMN